MLKDSQLEELRQSAHKEKDAANTKHTADMEKLKKSEFSKLVLRCAVCFYLGLVLASFFTKQDSV